jgi:HK97 family phage portal protein
MSILFRKSEERNVVLPPDLVARLNSGFGWSSAGVPVDADSAMRHDAVWACRTRISQDVSMMPVDVVRYQGDARVEVNPVPQIIAAPSVHVDAMDWRYQVVDSWLGWGNAWGIVTQTSPDMRYPTRIELQSPSCVRVQNTGDGLEIFVHNVKRELWPVGDLWHAPAYTVPGSFLGLSPIGYHALSIGVGLAAEKFGGDFFKDGGHPSALLTVDGQPTADQTAELKQRLLELTRGNREPLVMPSTTKYTAMQVNPTDSQFIETMRYSVEQVCRIYGEDPADYGSSAGGTAMTYANRSDADLARLKRRQYWVTKLQNVLSGFIAPPVVARLNTSVSLMMTARERHDLNKVRLDSKTITVNEIRRRDDEPPFDGAEFDQPGIPDGSTAEAEIERQAVILQKMYLAVGVVLTPDEARDMARKAGIDLPVAYDPALLGSKPQAAFGGDA